MPRTLADYLALQYPLEVIAEPESGYTIRFPDLPGCVSQVENLAEVGPIAEEIRGGWLKVAYEEGMDIPLPSYRDEYSGKFVLRLPKSLHRTLAESAEREAVSLNQYAVTILARGDAVVTVQQQLHELGQQVEAIHDRLRYSFSGVPASQVKTERRLIALDPVAA